jgi:predicted nuclease of predicted toxin-antitoxin system
MHRLFIDRDTWSRALDRALREAGIPFEAHKDHFARDATDPEWIRNVGAAGWLAVTRDQRIRHRPNEIAAVRAAALHLFVLTSGNLSAADTGRILVHAWPRMMRAADSRRPPAVWSVSRSAEVRLVKV